MFLKDLAKVFNELDIRAYSRKDSKTGTIIAFSSKTSLYHYMNRKKDETTGKWSWVAGQACQKQPSAAGIQEEVDA